jgi:hypothetical protein
MQVISSIHNLRMCQAVVTRDHLIWHELPTDLENMVNTTDETRLTAGPPICLPSDVRTIKSYHQMHIIPMISILYRLSLSLSDTKAESI